MLKDYEKWMPIKSDINNSKRHPCGYKEREIWICSFGENIGFEEDGKSEAFSRPVLILKVFNREFCHVIPLSTAGKKGKFYFAFDGKTGKISVALLSQSKAIDSSRLSRKIGVANKRDFQIIKEKVKEVLNL